MKFLMDHETLAHNEGFPTLATFIGLLPVVESLVVNQVSIRTKDLATIFTFIEILSRVEPLV